VDFAGGKRVFAQAAAAAPQHLSVFPEETSHGLAFPSLPKYNQPELKT
jgi:hypothetical protein